MLTQEVFMERVKALWASQQRMAAAKLWKSGQRAGRVRKPAAPLLFDRPALARWLWREVGLNAVACPYCGVPVDILSLTLDHIHPRSAGGEFSLGNMEVVCKGCNEMKGDMTREGFQAVLTFRRSLSPHDQAVLLRRLKEAHSGSASRFFRDKSQGQKQKKSARRDPQPQPSLDWF